MGAAFLCAKCQIDTATVENQASYIDSWLHYLRNDRRLVSEAAKSARMAVEYLDAGTTIAFGPSASTAAEKVAGL